MSGHGTRQKIMQWISALALLGMIAGCSSPEAAPTSGKQGVLGTLELRAVEFGFQPNGLAVKKPGRYKLTFTNSGKIVHDLTLSNGVKVAAKAGESKTVEIDVPAGGLTYVCSIPGHKEAGMRGAVLVAGQTASANPTDEHGHITPPANQPNPSAPPPPYVDPTAPGRSEETVHTFDVRAEEKLMTVAQGYEQRVWTFNGSVPAPTLRVRVGDTIRGRFMNMAANQTPHSLDFHASEVAWNGQMATINPGESLAFEWKANHAGIYMYHCVTAPPVHHVASGMFGMMIVEPKQGLPPVNKEFFLVQNEWYLGPQKEPISLTKAAAGAPAPDFMAFNGIADQYVEHPLRVDSGERVRMFVLNAGPNLMSSLHIVGMVFDAVIKEGVALTRDNSGQYGSQAVDLAPAQGAIVEFTAPEDGMYEIVTHMFNYHDRGAHGLIQVGDGIPKGKFSMARR